MLILTTPHSTNCSHCSDDSITPIFFLRQAEEHLNVALQINKHDKTFMMLGNVHLLAGETDKAIEVYKRAVE